MCANFKTVSPQQCSQLSLPFPDFDYPEEIYPGSECPIIFKSASGLEWRKVMFGMVPKWSKDSKICRSTYNARSESVFEKPSFKDAWHNNQFCLIPAAKIYEPRYVERNKSERWAIQQTDDQPFTIAGLYQIARINGQIIRSMTMLTINADNNTLMRQFHKPEDEKRVVVVIPPEYREQWLTGSYQAAPSMLFDLNQHQFKAYHDPRPPR